VPPHKSPLVPDLPSAEDIASPFNDQLDQLQAVARGTTSSVPSGTPLSQWSVDDVEAWAISRNMPTDIVATLSKHAIIGAVLPTLTEPELESMGITKFGWRRQLVIAIRELAQSHGIPDSTLSLHNGFLDSATPNPLARQFSSGHTAPTDPVFQVFPTLEADIEAMPMACQEESRAVVCAAGPCRNSSRKQMQTCCSLTQPSVVRAHSAERAPVRRYSDAGVVKAIGTTPDASLTRIRVVSPARTTIHSPQSTLCLPITHSSRVISPHRQRSQFPPTGNSLGAAWHGRCNAVATPWQSHGKAVARMHINPC